LIYCLRYVLSTIHSCAIIELQKEQPPQYKGLAYKKIEIPRYQPSIQGGFSIAHFWGFRKRYLQFTKIKVSNAIMNIPKAIRSLKSYFIRTTSHLCNVGGQRPCSNTIAPCHYGNISHFNVQLLFPAAVRSPTTAFSTLMMKTSHYLTTAKKLMLPLHSSSRTNEGVANCYPIQH